MDKLTPPPPIRTPITVDPPNATTPKEWYYFFLRSADSINQLIEKIKGGGGGGDGGGSDVLGPVTAVSGSEVGTRYVSDPDRLVHMTVGIVPVGPTPQNVTYFISPDDGANWVWIGWQMMHNAGQVINVDRLVPGQTAQWKVAAVAGAQGGDPSPIADSGLDVLYPGVVRSSSFTVAGLPVPAPSTGITATIGDCTNVISADGFTQYGRIEGVEYTDPIGTTAFFVRITVQDLDSSKLPLGPEKPHGGTQITGGSHTEAPLLVTYIPGLAFIRYRFYLANRNSQGEGDFSDPATNTLQMVLFNGSATTDDHYDVPITIPPFTPISPEDVFNVTGVTASEVGPKYQDEKQGLHTTIGVIATIDAPFNAPHTVTIWFDFGTGTPVWQGWYALTSPGQTTRIGDSTLGTDGVRKAGDIWVPANLAQGNWVVYCAAGRIDDGIDPTTYAHFNFTVVPVQACLPNGTKNAHFLPDPATGDPISYSLWDPGIWYWEYYCLEFSPPSLSLDPNYWFTLVTVQKGATIGGVWTPAPDSEGIDEDPLKNFLGRAHVQIGQLPGVANDQQPIMKKFGARPATWVIPPAQTIDLTPNPYREFRFLLYSVSRLGTDTSGSGGAGTYTLQTSCWPGGADHFILTPAPQDSALDMRAANPNTIELPLTGGNGQPMTVAPDSISGAYLEDQAIQARHMAESSITAANKALAASSVVDPNLVSITIAKVTYGTSIFAGDVVLSRGPNLPVIVLQNTGIFLYGQADASTGAAGLTSKPYVAIQNNAIGLFQGGAAGGSVYLDGANNAITIYNKNGDTTKPYLTIAAAGVSAVNGPNSMTIGSNAMSFIDTQFNNRLDMNSAGLSVANATNKLVITSSALQLQYNGVAQVTINSSGITVSNGGTASVTITPSQVTIVNGNLTAAAINGGSLNIGTANGTVTINNATSGVQVAGSGNTTRLNPTVISIGDNAATQQSEMTPNSLLIGRFLSTYCGLNAVPGSSDGLFLGGSRCAGLNGVWLKSVQTNDHVYAGDFGINGVATGKSGTFTSADGKTITVTGGIVTSIL